jgi:cellulose synthase/poly-beta-1,6-N-acetylglucosamine synthase-like glycosyltransferase
VLRALLLAGIVSAPTSSAALFVPARYVRRVTGRWPSIRRFVFALVGTAVLAAVIATVLVENQVSRMDTTVAVAAFAAFSVAWLPATRRWNARGHLCWVSSVFLFVSYLAFILQWMLTSPLGAASTVGGLLLWVLELLAAVLACAYLWELCDRLGTEWWRRRVTEHMLPAASSGVLPFVSLHVPAHNEPPDMVIQTLESLLRIDYPHYEIVVIDDNTDDERLWRPVADWCASHGVKFAHLQDWPGYKSGALNYALRNLTDPRAELIGVVDSDYQLLPQFLARCAPLFADPDVGFIQAPQDYRDWRQARYYRRLYYSYEYFFAVSQPSRNERNGAIFAGTMGLIRRRALDQLGGWDEWCITEDAELSLRLLRAGWSGLHVDQSFGRGVMPLTFEALKSQRYRWCFGGIQILRMHARALLHGRQPRNQLTLGQRWAYLSGALQWYGDLLGLAFFLFLLGGAVNLTLGGGELLRKLTAFLVATIPVLVALGLIRAVVMVRRGTSASWREAIGAFFVWQSTSLVVARASVQGLYKRKAAFLRTPKTGETTDWWQSIRANWAETSLALLGVLAFATAMTHEHGYSGPLLAGLLIFPTLGLAAAPFNSLAARRASLPEDLRQRRRTEWLRDRTFARGAAVGSLATALVGAIAAVLTLLLLPSQHLMQLPQVFGRTAPSPPAPVQPTPAPTSTPTTSSSPTAPTTTPAPTTTTTGSPTPTPAPTTSTAPATSPATTTPPATSPATSTPPATSPPATTPPATSAPAGSAPTANRPIADIPSANTPANNQPKR